MTGNPSSDVLEPQQPSRRQRSCQIWPVRLLAVGLLSISALVARSAGVEAFGPWGTGPQPSFMPSSHSDPDNWWRDPDDWWRSGWQSCFTCGQYARQSYVPLQQTYFPIMPLQYAALVPAYVPPLSYTAPSTVTSVTISISWPRAAAVSQATAPVATPSPTPVASPVPPPAPPQPAAPQPPAPQPAPTVQQAPAANPTVQGPGH